MTLPATKAAAKAADGFPAAKAAEVCPAANAQSLEENSGVVKTIWTKWLRGHNISVAGTLAIDGGGDESTYLLSCK